MQLFVRKALIILLSICGACIYGVVHDQITARLCLEYFTIAHPPLFHTRSTSLLALYWGVAATIGIGALLGVVLARVSLELGSRGTAKYETLTAIPIDDFIGSI